MYYLAELVEEYSVMAKYVITWATIVSYHLDTNFSWHKIFWKRKSLISLNNCNLYLVAYGKFPDVNTVTPL